MLNNRVYTSESWYKYLFIAILLFGVICLEKYISIPTVLAITGKNPENWGVAEGILIWVITIVFWLLGCFMLLIYSKKRLAYSPFKNKEKPRLKSILFCGLIIVIVIIIHTFILGGLKPILEFKAHTNRFANLGILTYMVQYLYYASEIIVVVLILVYSQKAGELLFKSNNIPWGGIFTGLTWGINHVFTQHSFSIGMYSVFTSVIFGVFYLLCKKNLVYAYPIILLAFIM